MPLEYLGIDRTGRREVWRLPTEEDLERAFALLDGRGYCLPEDVQAVFIGAAAHRLIPSGTSNHTRDQLAAALLANVPVR